MNPQPLRVLHIEDHRADHVLLRELLCEARIQVRLDWAESYHAGLDTLRRREHDVCLVDYELGAHTGLELLQEAVDSEIPIILLTGHAGPIDEAALRSGAADYLPKRGLEPHLVERSIRYALERHRALTEVRRRARHAEALNAIISVAATTSDLSFLLEATLQRLLAAIRGGGGTIWIPEHRYEVGYEHGWQRLWELTDEHGMTLDRVYATPDWQERIGLPGPMGEFAECFRGLDIRATLSVPLLGSDAALGGVFITAPEPREWQDDEIALVEAAALQVGNAIQRIRDLAERRLAEERRNRLIHGLQNVLSAADDLLDAPDLDDLLRRAVELGRSRLGLERCSIFLVDDDRARAHGTFGTDLQGRTTDERHACAPMDRDWNACLESAEAGGPRWRVLQHRAQWECVGGEFRPLPEQSWIAATAIRSHHGATGVFFNDTAGSGAPADPTQQELVAVYCSLLGTMIERKRDEERLRASEARLANAQRLAHLGNWELDLRTGELHWSDEIFRILGLEPAAGPVPRSRFWEFVHPDDAPRVRAASDAALRGEAGYDVEHRLRRSDGKERIVHEQAEVLFDDSGQAVRFVGTLLDVTERKLLEEQLRQSQKMEAIGRLAGGVAHDFNNMLAVINGYSELLLELPTVASDTRQAVAEIHRAGTRAAGLTRQLLAFSRKQMLSPRDLDLNSVVSGTQRMLQRLIGEDVRLEISLEPGLPQVCLDPTQIEQILLNLAVNSRDAMPHGGILRIETAVSRAFDGSAPPRVLLRVADSGSGIHPDDLPHVFEPFFTTKGVGAGTGLGLATVYGIVEQSHGAISVESQPGCGATFTIDLPASGAGVQPDVAAPLPSPPGSETILLVEDEQMLRALVRDILRRKGHTVLEAAHGDEALHLSRNHPGRIDLLLTDVVMPGLSGRQVAERLTLLRPEMRVMYMSGYTDDAIIRYGVEQETAAWIDKPFTPASLLAKVRETLDRRDASRREGLGAGRS
jgi:PAS domain S-box-containing protein